MKLNAGNKHDHVFIEHCLWEDMVDLTTPVVAETTGITILYYNYWVYIAGITILYYNYWVQIAGITILYYNYWVYIAGITIL